ncbi:MAG: alpha-ketoacid dehydrogenase subunit beta [Thermodesulfobacteriota bacterium]
MPWTKIAADSQRLQEPDSSNSTLRRGTYRDAILEATMGCMEMDKNVFVLGEGVDDVGGVFGTTKGLIDIFGPQRVIDTPLAENGITGVAMGAALAGMRPLLVHMRVDFLPLSLDQIANHAAKWSYMFGGNTSVPLTIRAITGRGWGSAAQHSQSLQAVFAHFPGLKVVMPATPYDAKGLLIASLYDNNPVLFLEHRWLYDLRGHLPAEMYRVPIGKAAVRREGKDVTIVAISQMVGMAMEAAETLEKDGINCEVVDLRSIKPLDIDLIRASVQKTGRLVVADTAWKEYGASAEILALVMEDRATFAAMKAPGQRVALPDVPTPASHVLEEAFYRGPGHITEAVKKVLQEA